MTILIYDNLEETREELKSQLLLSDFSVEIKHLKMFSKNCLGYELKKGVDAFFISSNIPSDIITAFSVTQDLGIFLCGYNISGVSFEGLESRANHQRVCAYQNIPNSYMLNNIFKSYIAFKNEQEKLVINFANR